MDPRRQWRDFWGLALGQGQKVPSLGSTVTVVGRTEFGWRKRPSIELKSGERNKEGS